MKTKTVLALTLVGITTLFAPLTTEARGFWDNIIKIPQKIDVNNIIKNTSVKNYNINLDGTYYGVAVSKASGYKNNDKIMISNTRRFSMIQIRPVSDLRNNFTEVEKAVECGEPVYLTKNGYGTMVVLSIEAYSSLTDGVEAALDAADRYAEENDRRYSHEEVFSNLRRRING